MDIKTVGRIRGQCKVFKEGKLTEFPRTEYCSASVFLWFKNLWRNGGGNRFSSSWNLSRVFQLFILWNTTAAERSLN